MIGSCTCRYGGYAFSILSVAPVVTFANYAYYHFIVLFMSNSEVSNSPPVPLQGPLNAIELIVQRGAHPL